MTYSFLSHTCCEQFCVFFFFFWLVSFSFAGVFELYLRRHQFTFVYSFHFKYFPFFDCDFLEFPLTSSTVSHLIYFQINRFKGEGPTKTSLKSWLIHTVACVKNAKMNFAHFSLGSLNLTMSYRATPSHHRIYFNLIYLFYSCEAFSFRFAILYRQRLLIQNTDAGTDNTQFMRSILIYLPFGR